MSPLDADPNVMLLTLALGLALGLVLARALLLTFADEASDSPKDDDDDHTRLFRSMRLNFLNIGIIVRVTRFLALALVFFHQHNTDTHYN